MAESHETVPHETVPHETVPHETVPRSNATRMLALGVGVVLIALIGLLAFGGNSEADSSSRLLGKRVPVIAGEAMLGGDFDIDHSRGRWVVINFFATWCPQCVAEHPDLIELDEWGKANNNLDVVAVVFDDSSTNIEAFFEQHGGDWPVMNDSQLSIDFQIRAVPETFLVDPDGVVVVHYTGGITAEQIKSVIQE
jgi:cytochrome c biogenesis protein CcmG/thiol:disulfide interchange protein DsbE